MKIEAGLGPIEKWQTPLARLPYGHCLTWDCISADGNEGLCCWLWHVPQCALTQKALRTLTPEHCGVTSQGKKKKRRHRFTDYLTAAAAAAACARLASDPASHHSNVDQRGTHELPRLAEKLLTIGDY